MSMLLQKGKSTVCHELVRLWRRRGRDSLIGGQSTATMGSGMGFGTSNQRRGQMARETDTEGESEGESDRLSMWRWWHGASGSSSSTIIILLLILILMAHKALILLHYQFVISIQPTHGQIINRHLCGHVRRRALHCLGFPTSLHSAMHVCVCECAWLRSHILPLAFCVSVLLSLSLSLSPILFRSHSLVPSTHLWTDPRF